MGGMKQEERIAGVSVCCPPSPVPTFFKQSLNLCLKKSLDSAQDIKT